MVGQKNDWMLNLNGRSLEYVILVFQLSKRYGQEGMKTAY
jgi:hypothetical protein